MEENARNQILLQEMVRRLMNTSEGLPEEEYSADNYAEKLKNSGYSLEQIRRILLAGIKGYGAKKLRREQPGVPLRRTAEESQGARMKNKLVGKSTWFKKTKNKGRENENKKGGDKMGAKKVQRGSKPRTPSTVLFVEQTPGGELAQRLRELFTSMEPTIGFAIKVVERTGATLRSKFPLYNLWEGAKCGRVECIPCGQGAEFVQQCTKTSVVYENICSVCNPGAEGKRELKELNMEFPTTYVGETSRSIMERTREHWGAYTSKNKESHMLKYQELQHGGAAPPSFIMRVVRSTRTALERQTTEAVRIRRRGGEGAILNSKAEFNHCYIPRLQLEVQDVAKMEKEEKQDLDKVGDLLEKELENWEQQTKFREQKDRKYNKSLGRSMMSKQTKHQLEENKKEPKRRK